MGRMPLRHQLGRSRFGPFARESGLVSLSHGLNEAVSKRVSCNGPWVGLTMSTYLEVANLRRVQPRCSLSWNTHTHTHVLSHCVCVCVHWEGSLLTPKSQTYIHIFCSGLQDARDTPKAALLNLFEHAKWLLPDGQNLRDLRDTSNCLLITAQLLICGALESSKAMGPQTRGTKHVLREVPWQTPRKRPGVPPLHSLWSAWIDVRRRCL